MTARGRRLRRLRRIVVNVVGLAVIGLALVVGALGLAMPWLEAHPEVVREHLEQRLGREVRIGRVAGQWTPRGPVFTLERVQIVGAGGAPFEVQSAQLAIDFYGPLTRGTRLAEFAVVGVDLALLRDADGRWHAERLGGAGTGDAGEGLDALFGLGGVSLRQARVQALDAVSGRRLALSRVDVTLREEDGTRRVAGRVRVADDSPPLELSCAFTDGSGRCYVEGRRLEPRRWLAQAPLLGLAPGEGHLDVRAWLDFAEARVESARLSLGVPSLVLRALTPEVDPQAPGLDATLRELSLEIDARREAGGWRVDAEQSGALRMRLALRTLAQGFDLRVDEVALEALWPVLAASSLLPAEWRARLHQASPRGRIENLTLSMREGRVRAVQARLLDLASAPAGRLPGLGPLRATVYGDGEAFVLEPEPASRLLLDTPGVFREPIALEWISGAIVAHRADDGWRADLVEFAARGEDHGLHGRASLHLDGTGKRPSLCLSIAVDDSGIAQAKRYWAVNTMPPKTVAWLDRALVAGRVEGEAVIRGDLDDWPFKRAQGRFEAQARVRDATLDYHARWPRAEEFDGDVVFVGNGMALTAGTARIHGNEVTASQGRIEDFKSPIMVLTVEGRGSGEDLLALLRESPIAERAGEDLASLSVGGEAELDFTLTQPLKAALGEEALTGRVLLVDADLADTRWNLRFPAANGLVHFGRRGFTAESLAVRFGDAPATLSIATGEFVADPAHAIEGALQGRFPLAILLSAAPGSEAVANFVPDATQWHVSLAVAEAVDARTPARRLTLSSDLVGTRVVLPAPLAKDADSALPITVSLDLPLAGSRASVTLGKLLRAQVQLPGGARPLAARVDFGVAEPGPMPPSGLLVRGDVPALDLGGWASVGQGGDPKGAFGPVDVAVDAGALFALSRAFADTRVELAVKDGTKTLRVAGPEVDGTLTMPGGDSGITAAFERLHLPEALASPPPAVPVDPAKIPPLHVWARSLRFGAAQLGEARIETFPREHGMRLDRIETSAPNLSIRARGDWTLQDGVEQSAFDVTFTAESLGRMLDALGFSGIVEGGQTMARIEGRWPGSPAQFALARIDGSLAVEVGRGRILEVEPGAGRIFGLLSVAAIPRRLALDFSDFFGQGLAFDTIAGRFELREGDAWTEDLYVKGPSADIRVSGRTGLSKRDYDQQLEVTPRVGGVFPALGALAAGPAGAAAGLVVQNVLRAPLKDMVRARYRVTGSWEKPDVELLEKRGVRAEG